MDFFLGSKRASNPTLAPVDGHDGSMTQVREGNRVFTLKHGSRPDSFEMHLLDGAGVWIREDHGAEGRGWSYGIENGLWLARDAKVGWRVTNSAYLTNRDPQCVAKHRGAWPVNTGPYTFTVALIAHEWRDVGGDLGRQEVIVLLYSDNEEFVYSREWGWIGWFNRSQGVGGYWNKVSAPAGVSHIPACN
jgi:hypothetical protein